MLKKVRQMLCWMLSFLTALSTVCLSPQTAKAAVGDVADIDILNDGQAYHWANNVYFTLPNGQQGCMEAGSEYVRLTVGGQDAYCIQPGMHITGWGIPYTAGDSSDYWQLLSYDVQHSISLTILFGYPNHIFDRNNGYRATQLIIWEYILGWRNPITGVCTNSSLRNAIIDDDIGRFYNQISSDLMSHSTIPSFMGRAISLSPVQTLTYNATTGLYEATLNDKNGMLSVVDLGSANGVSLIKNGNSLKVTSNHPISGTTSILCQKPLHLADNISRP